MSTIAISDEVHIKIIEKQTELLKSKNKVRMLDLNNYIIKKGLNVFNDVEFLNELGIK